MATIEMNKKELGVVTKLLRDTVDYHTMKSYYKDEGMTHEELVELQCRIREQYNKEQEKDRA